MLPGPSNVPFFEDSRIPHGLQHESDIPFFDDPRIPHGNPGSIDYYPDADPSRITYQDMPHELREREHMLQAELVAARGLHNNTRNDEPDPPNQERPLARISFGLDANDITHFALLGMSIAGDKLFAPSHADHNRIVGAFGCLSTASLDRFRQGFTYVLSTLPREVRMECARKQAQSEGNKQVWYSLLQNGDLIFRRYAEDASVRSLYQERAAEWIRVINMQAVPSSTEVIDECKRLVGELPRQPLPPIFFD